MRVNRKMRGDCFGEVSLMYSCPRSATVAATQDAVVWVLERDVFRCADYTAPCGGPAGWVTPLSCRAAAAAADGDVAPKVTGQPLTESAPCTVKVLLLCGTSTGCDSAGGIGQPD